MRINSFFSKLGMIGLIGSQPNRVDAKPLKATAKPLEVRHTNTYAYDPNNVEVVSDKGNVTATLSSNGGLYFNSENIQDYGSVSIDTGLCASTAKASKNSVTQPTCWDATGFTEELDVPTIVPNIIDVSNDGEWFIISDGQNSIRCNVANSDVQFRLNSNQDFVVSCKSDSNCDETQLVYEGGCFNIKLEYTQNYESGVENDDVDSIDVSNNNSEAFLGIFSFIIVACVAALNQYLEGAIVNAFRKCCRSTLVRLHCISDGDRIYNCLTTAQEVAQNRQSATEDRIDIIVANLNGGRTNGGVRSDSDEELDLAELGSSETDFNSVNNHYGNDKLIKMCSTNQSSKTLVDSAVDLKERAEIVGRAEFEVVEIVEEEAEVNGEATEESDTEAEAKAEAALKSYSDSSSSGVEFGNNNAVAVQAGAAENVQIDDVYDRLPVEFASTCRSVLSFIEPLQDFKSHNFIQSLMTWVDQKYTDGVNETVDFQVFKRNMQILRKSLDENLVKSENKANKIKEKDCQKLKAVLKKINDLYYLYFENFDHTSNVHRTYLNEIKYQDFFKELVDVFTCID